MRRLAVRRTVLSRGGRRTEHSRLLRKLLCVKGGVFGLWPAPRRRLLLSIGAVVGHLKYVPELGVVVKPNTCSVWRRGVRDSCSRGLASPALATMWLARTSSGGSCSTHHNLAGQINASHTKRARSSTKPDQIDHNAKCARVVACSARIFISAPASAPPPLSAHTRGPRTHLLEQRRLLRELGGHAFKRAMRPGVRILQSRRTNVFILTLLSRLQ
eukprot:SAG11_NODE_6171_length_1372_cov_1.189317_1_plen_214_part_01